MLCEMVRAGKYENRKTLRTRREEVNTGTLAETFHSLGHVLVVRSERKQRSGQDWKLLGKDGGILQMAEDNSMRLEM